MRRPALTTAALLTSVLLVSGCAAPSASSDAATATTAAAAASAAPSLVCGRWLRAATTAVSGFGLDPLGVARGTLLLAPPFPFLATAAPSSATTSSALVA